MRDLSSTRQLVAAVHFQALRFWIWWTEELYSVAAGFWMSSHAASQVVVAGVGDKILLIVADGTVTELIEEPPFNGLELAHVRTALSKRTSTRRCTIRVPSRACFRISTTIPRAAVRNVHDIVDLEVEATTPFRSDRYLWGSRILSQDRHSVAVETLVISKGNIQPLRDIAAKLATSPPSLETYDEDVRLGCAVPLFRWPGEPAADNTHHTIAAIVLASICVFCVVVGFKISAQYSALATLEQQVAVARRELQDETRKLAASRAGINRFKSLEFKRLATPFLADVWEEASALLPDDTWLITLRKTGQNISFVGYTESAAMLIDLLSKSHNVRDPQFTAPVVVDQRLARQRFEISATLNTRDAVVPARKAE